MYTKQLTQCLLFSESSTWGIVIVTESKRKEKRMVWLPLMTNSPKVAPYVLAGCGRAANCSLCWVVKPGWSQPVSLMVYCAKSPNASEWMVLAPILHHLMTTKETPQLPLGSAWQVHGQDSFFLFSFFFSGPPPGAEPAGNSPTGFSFLKRLFHPWAARAFPFKGSLI